MTVTEPATNRQVAGWRFEELRHAGYGEREALELAMRADVDLHTAIDLIRRGCSQETALRILR
jgi:hypothetical protein